MDITPIRLWGLLQMDTDKQKDTVQEEALEYRMSAREYTYGEYITWPDEFRKLDDKGCRGTPDLVVEVGIFE
jgi:hypothetical protein